MPTVIPVENIKDTRREVQTDVRADMLKYVSDTEKNNEKSSVILKIVFHGRSFKMESTISTGMVVRKFEFGNLFQII